MTKVHYIKTILLAATAACFAYPSAAGPHFPSSVVVIKGGQAKLSKAGLVRDLLASQDAELKIYDIDGADRFEQSISVNLPADPGQARAAFQRRVDRAGRGAFEQHALNAYRGIMAAVRHRVKAYPAVIFDGSSVVYGVPDLAGALAHYQRWKAEQGGAQ